MSKSIDEMILLLSEIAKESEGYVATALEVQDPSWATENLEIAFRNYLLCGLYEWRRARDPRSHFADALAISKQALDIPSAAVYQLFSVGCAGIISYLADDHKAICCPALIEASRVREKSRSLDAMLALVLREEGSAYDLRVRLDDLKRPNELLRETFITYHDLLIADEAQWPRLVDKAESLFKKREQSTYYKQSAQYEGGGGDNADVVDFRLGAVLAYCDRVRGLKSRSGHLWLWDE